MQEQGFSSLCKNRDWLRPDHVHMFNLIYVIFKDFRSHDFIPINNLWIFKYELFFL